MSRGIVVDHKESGVRYAISESNFNDAVHKRVRELVPGETVLGYQPIAREALGGAGDSKPTRAAAVAPTDLSETASKTPTATAKHQTTK